MDASHELIRLARTRNTETDQELRVLLEENDSIDENYEVALFSLPTMENTLDPCEKKNENDDVTRHKKRLSKSKKRKGIDDISKNDDDCSSGEENDPQYQLVLKHLKMHDKAYVIKYQQGCLPVVINYEEDTYSDKERDPDFEPRKPSRALSVGNKRIPKRNDRRMSTLKHKCRPPKQMCGVENQIKHDSQSISVKTTNNANKVENVDSSPSDMVVDPKHLSLHQIIKFGGDHDFSMLRSHTEIKENTNDLRQEDGKKLQRATKSNSEISNQMSGMENQWCTSVKNTESLTRGKSINEIDNEVNHLHQDNKFEDDPHSLLENQCKHDLPNKAFPLIILVDDSEDDWIECSASEFMEVKAAKCLAYNKVEVNNFEKEGKGNSHSDVEMLDEATYFEKGISSPFVSSRKYSKSMEEDGIQQIGSSSAAHEFRKRALQVLQKPYDKEEYTRLLKVVRDGGYLESHKDLEAKLKKHRYNKRKRLTILRGFFFWIQNLTQEGSFKPWKDCACLAVKPPSPERLRTPNDGHNV